MRQQFSVPDTFPENPLWRAEVSTLSITVCVKYNQSFRTEPVDKKLTAFTKESCPDISSMNFISQNALFMTRLLMLVHHACSLRSLPEAFDKVKSKWDGVVTERTCSVTNINYFILLLM